MSPRGHAGDLDENPMKLRITAESSVKGALQHGKAAIRHIAGEKASQSATVAIGGDIGPHLVAKDAVQAFRWHADQGGKVTVGLGIWTRQVVGGQFNRG
jgi:hypothetical protein